MYGIVQHPIFGVRILQLEFVAGIGFLGKLTRSGGVGNLMLVWGQQRLEARSLRRLGTVYGLAHAACTFPRCFVGDGLCKITLQQ